MAIKKAELDREISKAITQLTTDMEEWKSTFAEQTKHEMSLMAEELKKQHHSEMEVLKNKMAFDMEIKSATISESFKGRIDALMDVIKQKDDAINLLNKHVGELQASLNITGDDIAKIQKDNSTMSENISGLCKSFATRGEVPPHFWQFSKTGGEEGGNFFRKL